MDAEAAAAAGRELMPAAQTFANAVGKTGIGQELGQWLADVVRYRRAPHQARLLMKAAERVRASGLPTVAVEDGLVRAVLEEGAFEDDGPMQERWANLLANAALGVRVPPAFPEILRQLEPVEAVLLDRLVSLRQPRLNGLHTTLTELGDVSGLQWRNLDNLERLQVANWNWLGRTDRLLPPTPRDSEELTVEVFETQLGRSLVEACHEPPSS